MEEFKDIKEYEGLYQISSLGRVKSLNYNKTKKEKILKQSKIYNGYLKVLLSKEGKHKTFTVHRLVAEAFIPNPHVFPCVNHKDEDKTNNNVDNLEWCNHKYNNTYGNRTQKMVAKIDYKQIAKKLSKSVLQFTKDGEFVREYKSTAECERNGFNHSAVGACCRGERKSHKGFIWRYKNG